MNAGPRASEPTRVLPTHTRELFEAAVEEAADRLAAGELVALPTETVYGLAANAFNAEAVQRIYEVKGRSSRNPIIVHVADLAQARQCVAEWPDSAGALAHAFWPGPLTLVLPRSALIPDAVTAGGTTVGVRWPSHPLIQAVIRRCGFPLAAPSANLSLRVSPTTAAHVLHSLGSRIPCVVDGGPAQVGIESTVLDLSGDRPRILRPGMIHEESLVAVVGEMQRCPGEPEGILRSPGQLARHYAPLATLRVLGWTDDADLRRQLAAQQIVASRAQVLAHTTIPSAAGLAGVSIIPHDPVAFARALYAELHRCDAGKGGWIVVERVPEAAAWSAIADRLRRAESS